MAWSYFTLISSPDKWGGGGEMVPEDSSSSVMHVCKIPVHMHHTDIS